MQPSPYLMSLMPRPGFPAQPSGKPWSLQFKPHIYTGHGQHDVAFAPAGHSSLSPAAVATSFSSGSLAIANRAPGPFHGHQTGVRPRRVGQSNPLPSGPARVVLRPAIVAAPLLPFTDHSSGCTDPWAISRPVQTALKASHKRIPQLTGQKRIAEQTLKLKPSLKQSKLVKVPDRPKPEHYQSMSTWCQSSLTCRLQLLALAEPELWNPATAISIRTLEEVDASLAIGFDIWRNSIFPTRQLVQPHQLDLLRQYQARGCPLKGERMEDILIKYHQLVTARGSSDKA